LVAQRMMNVISRMLKQPLKLSTTFWKQPILKKNWWFIYLLGDFNTPFLKAKNKN